VLQSRTGFTRNGSSLFADVEAADCRNVSYIEQWPAVQRAMLVPSQPSIRLLPAGILMPTPTMSRTGFFSEGALDRILQAMDGAMDCQIHRRVTMRHDDGLAAIATRLDHAAFIAMADLAADFVAEVHIYSPDAISKAVQRRMHDGLHMVRKLLAALNVAICSNLDEHQLSPLSQRRPII
jgi:hypothetical protein